MGGLNNRMKNYRLLYVILPVLGGSLRAVPRCKITIKMRNYGALVAMCIPDFGKSKRVETVTPLSEWHEAASPPWSNDVLEFGPHSVSIGLPRLCESCHQCKAQHVKMIANLDVVDRDITLL